MPPKFESIDHIHINVSDRAVAENWYRDYLGFVRDPVFEPWVTERGPLALTKREGNIQLALFKRSEIQKHSRIEIDIVDII